MCAPNLQIARVKDSFVSVLKKLCCREQDVKTGSDAMSSSLGSKTQATPYCIEERLSMQPVFTRRYRPKITLMTVSDVQLLLKLFSFKGNVLYNFILSFFS